MTIYFEIWVKLQKNCATIPKRTISKR